MPRLRSWTRRSRARINSLFVDVITTYAGDTSGGGDVDRKANNTKVYFPKDYSFSTAGLSQRQPERRRFRHLDHRGRQDCSAVPSQVGTGSAAIVGPIAGITAVVTAFNGTKPAGLDTILLHSRTSLGTTTVLTGHSEGERSGRLRQDARRAGPAAAAWTLAISDFKTNIGKIQLPKAGPASSAAKKKKKSQEEVLHHGQVQQEDLEFPGDFHVSTSGARPPRRPLTSASRRRPRRRSKGLSAVRAHEGRPPGRPSFFGGPFATTTRHEPTSPIAHTAAGGPHRSGPRGVRG